MLRSVSDMTMRVVFAADCMPEWFTRQPNAVLNHGPESGVSRPAVSSVHLTRTRCSEEHMDVTRCFEMPVQCMSTLALAAIVSGSWASSEPGSWAPRLGCTCTCVGVKNNLRPMCQLHFCAGPKHTAVTVSPAHHVKWRLGLFTRQRAHAAALQTGG
jgi:hypothetical protein